MLSLVAAVLLATSLVQAQQGFVDNFDGTTVNSRYKLPTYGVMGAGTFVSGGYLIMPLPGDTGANATGAQLSVAAPAGDWVATTESHLDLSRYDANSGWLAATGLTIFSDNYVQGSSGTMITIENIKERPYQEDTYAPFLTSATFSATDPSTYSLYGLAMYPRVKGAYSSDPLWTSSGAGQNSINNFDLMRTTPGPLLGLWATNGQGVNPNTGASLSSWNCTTGDIYYRIAKIGSTYDFYVSGNGVDFTEVKSVTADANWDPITRIGLCTGGMGVPVTDVAQFKNFVVRQLGGDSNLDGKINFADYTTLSDNWLQNVGAGGAAVGDFNGDGVVNFADYTILSDNWLSADPYIGTYGGLGYTPEPVTMALLALGGLGLLRRRK